MEMKEGNEIAALFSSKERLERVKYTKFLDSRIVIWKDSCFVIKDEDIKISNFRKAFPLFEMGLIMMIGKNNIQFNVVKNNSIVKFKILQLDKWQTDLVKDVKEIGCYSDSSFQENASDKYPIYDLLLCYANYKLERLWLYDMDQIQKKLIYTYDSIDKYYPSHKPNVIIYNKRYLIFES